MISRLHVYATINCSKIAKKNPGRRRQLLCSAVFVGGTGLSVCATNTATIAATFRIEHEEFALMFQPLWQSCYRDKLGAAKKNFPTNLFGEGWKKGTVCVCIHGMTDYMPCTTYTYVRVVLFTSKLRYVCIQSVFLLVGLASNRWEKGEEGRQFWLLRVSQILPLRYSWMNKKTWFCGGNFIEVGPEKRNSTDGHLSVHISWLAFKTDVGAAATALSRSWTSGIFCLVSSLQWRDLCSRSKQFWTAAVELGEGKQL